MGAEQGSAIPYRAPTHEVLCAPQNAGQGVLVRDAEHDDAAAVVAIEVDPLRHLPASDGEEDRSPPAVARPPEIIQRQGGLHHIHRLYEHQLERHEGLPGYRPTGPFST